MLFDTLKQIPNSTLFEETDGINIDLTKFSDNIIVFAIYDNCAEFFIRTYNIKAVIEKLNIYGFEYHIHSSDEDENRCGYLRSNSFLYYCQFLDKYDAPGSIQDGAACCSKDFEIDISHLSRSEIKDINAISLSFDKYTKYNLKSSINSSIAVSILLDMGNIYTVNIVNAQKYPLNIVRFIQIL